MDQIDTSNLRKITTDNAAKNGDVWVINLGLGQLDGYQGYFIDVGGFRENPFIVYIQPTAQTDDVIEYGGFYAVAASGGNDTIELSVDVTDRPRPNQNPAVTGGPGEDRIFVQDGNEGSVVLTAYGGSGNDQISGGQYEDTLSGDAFDDGSILGGGAFEFDVPAAAPGNDILLGLAGDDTLNGNAGNDQLFGQQGSDTLNGGPGNDFLYGGPRGRGFLDVLYGDTGADAFLLSYVETASGGGSASFWDDYTSNFLDDSALDEAQAIVESAGKAALKDAFEDLASGLILTGVGDLLGAFLQFLVDLIDSPKPVSTEDVLVIPAFNPSEDVLLLPVNENLTLDATVANFTSSGVKNLQGWGIKYTDGTADTVFAEVFLAEEYLTALGITTQADVESILPQVLSQQVTISPSGLDNTKTAALAALSADGVLEAKTPAGSKVAVLGALGPVSVVEPSSLIAAGTAYGDILTLNQKVVLPEEFATNAVGKFSPTEGGTVVGFAGDDLLYGSVGSDTINGGGGNDDIYGFFPALGSTLIEPDKLNGGAGNDLIVTGMAKADVDGGAGFDTISFELNFGPGSGEPTFFPVTVDLAKGTASDGTLTDNYTITGVEGIVGSPNGDMLTGDSGDNFIDGFGGKDNIDGGGGINTLSFARMITPVTVDMTAGTAVSKADDGASVDYVFKNMASVIGTAAGDTITGDANDNVIEGNGGTDTLDGGLGTDSVSFAFATGELTLDLRNQVVAGTDADASTISNFEAAIGGAEASNTFYGFTAASVQSQLVGAQVANVFVDGQLTAELKDSFFPNAAVERIVSNARNVDVSYVNSPAGVTIDLVEGGPLRGGWAEGDILEIGDAAGDSLAIFGSAFADRLTGDGGRTLQGNGGDDIYGIGTGENVISGFNLSEDKIDVSSQGIVSYSQLQITSSLLATSVTAGASTLILFDYGGSLPASAFIFASPEAGTSVVDGTPGATETLRGGSHRDVMGGYGGDKTIFGRGGDDEIYAGALGGLEPDGGSNTVDGGTGDDAIYVNSHGANGVDGGTGQDEVTVRGDGNNSVAGGTSADTITIVGDGNNTVDGGTGADTILIEGDGDNQVDGRSGADFIVVLGDGDNRITGGAGADVLSTLGSGDNELDGGSGDDGLFSGDGDDLISSGAGDDEVLAGGGEDTVLGGTGNDLIRGEEGDDTLDGGAGDDILRGDEGNDVLTGGFGADDLNGGLDDDDLEGGLGRDLFIFDGGDFRFFGNDSVLDFQPGVDRLSIPRATADDVVVTSDDEGLLLTVDGPAASGTIRLMGVNELNDGALLLVDTPDQVVDQDNDASMISDGTGPSESLNIIGADFTDLLT